MMHLKNYETPAVVLLEGEFATDLVSWQPIFLFFVTLLFVK